MEQTWWRKHLVTGAALAGGFIAGALAMAVMVWLVMPHMMLSVHESDYNLEETCRRLKASIEEEGWNCPAIRNMNRSTEKHGVVMDRQVRLVELCRAEYADDILSSNPEVSTLMPCAMGVYEKDGRVYVSGMNMGLMGKMFGGNIARVMKSVSADESRIKKCLE